MKNNIKVVDMHDDFKCDCGNTSSSSGFYPCDGKGNIIEPLPNLWKDLMKCGACDQIYKLK